MDGQHESDRSSVKEAPVFDARRRVLRGAFGAAPVVMSVASRPVLGQVACVSASASVSLNASGLPRAVTLCSGLTPEQWKERASEWPSPYQAGTPTSNGPANSPPNCTTTATASSTPTTSADSPSYAAYYRRHGRLPTQTTRTTVTTTVPCSTTTTTTSTPSTSISSNTSSSALQQYYRRHGQLPTESTAVSATTAAPTTTGSTNLRSYVAPPTAAATGNLPAYARMYYRMTGRLPTQLTSAAPITPTTTPTTQPASAPAADPGTPYHCSTTGLSGRAYADHTMLDVLDIGDGLGNYFVAALLNARSGRTPVLTEEGVRKMWNDVVNGGSYEPATGIRWTAQQVVAYIRTTMG